MTPNERSSGLAVEIVGLVKRYGDHRAVDGADLVVEHGEIFGILGANGAGKTTTVECAQGLRRADAGLVRVLGHDPVSAAHHLRGRVGSQLQDSHLPDRMRVEEAVRLFADREADADATMAAWDLAPVARSPFGALSGGQKQRLFLALAMLNEPEVVFLDELTQGLDPAARRSVWELVERVRARGTTVVLVTHFMEEAEVLCDRVAVMTDGHVVDTGTPQQLIDRHSDGVRVRFRGTPDDIAWLEAISGVASASYSRGEVEVRGASPVIAHLGAALVATDRVPDDLRVAQPDLEDALLDLLDPIGVRS